MAAAFDAADAKMAAAAAASTRSVEEAVGFEGHAGTTRAVTEDPEACEYDKLQRPFACADLALPHPPYSPAVLLLCPAH